MRTSPQEPFGRCLDAAAAGEPTPGRASVSALTGALAGTMAKANQTLGIEPGS